MTDIVLGILCFNVILIIFKLFNNYKVDNLQAIIINYFTAGNLGLYFSERSYSINEIVSSEWIPYAVTIGILFISVFYLLAKGAQLIGMAISTVANKMSVIIPVMATFFLYGDRFTVIKIIGIIMALSGVYLATTDGKKLNFNKKYLWLLIIIFLGQGIADTIFNYAQVNYVENVDVKIFFTVLFFSAGICGTLLLLKQIIKKQARIELKNITWGIGLGIPNFLTLLFFFRSLENGILESSQVYPIFNIGVVIISAIIGYLFFRENLKVTNWIGIGVSAVSIALISFG